jgi:hypothetical protein
VTRERDDDYHLVSHWRVPGTVEEVTEVFRRGADLPRWWPAVYLDAWERDPGDGQGLGYVTELRSKGWLPYTVRWRSTAVEVRHPHGFTIEAAGDFVGRGVWTFLQDGQWVDMTYDWRVRTNRPLLRRGARLFKPLFAWNHRWAMRTGEESLRLELARRRAATPAERARVPPPPCPAPTSPLRLLLGVAAVIGTGVGLAALARRQRCFGPRVILSGAKDQIRSPTTRGYPH